VFPGTVLSLGPLPWENRTCGGFSENRGMAFPVCAPKSADIRCSLRSHPQLSASSPPTNENEEGWHTLETDELESRSPSFAAGAHSFVQQMLGE
jgi:hypothetical protein